MNRREFTGLLAAGVVFPVDYVKGLAARGDVPRSKSGPRIYCCGSDYEPLSEEQSILISAFLEKKMLGMLTKRFSPRRWSVPRSWHIIEYCRAIGAPLNAIYQINFPLNRLVVGIGSDDRPAQPEDLIAVKNQLLELTDKWEGSIVVTHHNFYPYEFQGDCTLHSAPMVMTHRWTAGAGQIRRVPALWHHAFVPGWESARHDPLVHPW